MSMCYFILLKKKKFSDFQLKNLYEQSLLINQLSKPNYICTCQIVPFDSIYISLNTDRIILVTPLFST